MKKIASPILLTLSLFSLSLHACQPPEISINVNARESKASQSSTQNEENKADTRATTSKPRPVASKNTKQTRQASASPTVETLHRPSQLLSQDAGSKINVRSQPSISSTALHFGFSGDPVTLLKKSASANETWYFLKFEQSKATGWVRQDFVDLTYQEPDVYHSDAPATSTDYFGELPQAAELYRKNPNEKINVYSAPSFSANVDHYGLTKDKVLIQKIVLEDDGHWSYIRFDQSGAEGWVHDSDFLPQ